MLGVAPQPPAIGPLPSMGYLHMASSLPPQQYPPAAYPPLPPDPELPAEPPPAYEPPDKEQGALYNGPSGSSTGGYGSFQPAPLGSPPAMPPAEPHPVEDGNPHKVEV